MKFLVTGANGYIGSNLTRKLLLEGHSVNVLLRPGSKPNNIYGNEDKDNKLFEKLSIDYYYSNDYSSLEHPVKNADAIIHLAALYTLKNDFKSVTDLIESNILYSTQLFQNAKKFNPNIGIVSTSTFSSLNEKHNYDPTSLYAATKTSVEKIAKAFDLKIIFLRLGDTYGPNDWRPKVHNLLKNTLEKDENFIIRTNGKQKINLTHVDDVLNGLIEASLQLKNKDTSFYEIYDFFYPKNQISLKKISKQLLKEYENKGTVEFPIFGKIDKMPKAKKLLPNFKLEHNPNVDLAKTLNGVKF